MPDIFITLLASFLIWVMILILVILFLAQKISRLQVMQIISATLIAFAIANITKYIFPTLRPFLIEGGVPLTLSYHTDPAYPSSHTAVAFALAFSLFISDRKLSIPFIIMAVLVGIGRVLSYVHFPLDVFGGVLIGVASAGLINWASIKFKR